MAQVRQDRDQCGPVGFSAESDPWVLKSWAAPSAFWPPTGNWRPSHAANPPGLSSSLDVVRTGRPDRTARRKGTSTDLKGKRIAIPAEDLSYESENTDHDEVDSDDVIQQSRHDQYQDSRNQGRYGL